jgi:hypothetical protein
MTRRRKTTAPVPLGPLHRRTWQSLWRRCSCGLAAPCVDRLVPATPLPFPPRGYVVPWDVTPVPLAPPASFAPSAPETGGATPSGGPRPPWFPRPSAPSPAAVRQSRCSSPEVPVPAPLPADKVTPCRPGRAAHTADPSRPALRLRRATMPSALPRATTSRTGARLTSSPSPTTGEFGLPTQRTVPSTVRSTRRSRRNKATVGSRALRLAMGAGRPPCAERAWYGAPAEPVSPPSAPPRLATVTSLNDFMKHDIRPLDRTAADDKADGLRRPASDRGKTAGRHLEAGRPQMAYQHINLAHW